MKKITLIITCLLASITFGQSKKISLEESVLQQNRLFRADRMAGFQWVPNTNKYTYYIENGIKLMQANATETTPKLLLELKDLNKNMGSDLKSFFGMQWKNLTVFTIANGNKFYEFDIVANAGKLIQETPENTESQEFDNLKEQIAFTENNNLFFLNKAKQKITVTNNDDKNIVSGQTISRSEFGINDGIFWSPKSSYLAFYQKDETAVADYPLLDITETPGKLESIKYPMIGQKSEKPKVGIYNLATGKTVFISPRNNQEDYLTNLSWTPDEKFVLIAELNRAQNDMCLNLYDAATGAFVKTLINETSDKWVEPEHDAFFPNANSNNFIWFSEKDGFHQLYYHSLDGKLIKQLTNNKFPVREIIGTNATATEIYFKATGENPTNMMVYKVDLKGKQTLITKDLGVHAVSITSDGLHVFDEFSNHTTPSKSILIDKNLKSKTLLESANKYDGYTIGSSEIKTIKAADGTTDLYTRLIKPSNFDASKKYPVLVYVYGGPHAQMITNSFLDGANLWMYWMAEQGYLVFTVDNRGSDNRGFAFESVIHGKCGTNEIEDQIKGVDYLKSLPFVDGNRLAVHGWSYGGFMTTSLMLRKPDAFKVGIAGGPVTDWKYYEAMYGERYMDTPAENQKGFDESSTLNYVKNLKGKLLLIHGTSDDVVVMQHNFALIKKFIEAEKQVDFFAYPMHKHNVSGKDRVHLMRKVLDYVLENNK